MLLNQQGQVVHVNKKFNIKDNPNMFINLREIKEPTEVGHGNWFNLGVRAKFKQ